MSQTSPTSLKTYQVSLPTWSARLEDCFLINIISPALEASRELLSDVAQMIRPKAA